MAVQEKLNMMQVYTSKVKEDTKLCHSPTQLPLSTILTMEVQRPLSNLLALSIDRHRHLRRTTQQTFESQNVLSVPITGKHAQCLTCSFYRKHFCYCKIPPEYHYFLGNAAFWIIRSLITTINDWNDTVLLIKHKHAHRNTDMTVLFVLCLNCCNNVKSTNKYRRKQKMQKTAQLLYVCLCTLWYLHQNKW